MNPPFLIFLFFSILGYAEAATYTKSTSLSGQSFLDAFYWDSFSDPTHGRVNYLTQWDAQSKGLVSVSGNTVTLRADNTTVLKSSGPGRDSFRLTSNNQYDNHVAIFDIAHMPEGCGTWPAEVGQSWPDNGEIDIVEGVNNRVPNQSTLHTNCAMPSSRLMTGTSLVANCGVTSDDNEGCGVRLANSNSFGPDFNKIGGGFFAMERSSSYIAIYFWERNSSSVPSQVRSPGNSVDTSTWGTPAAYFPNTKCDFSSHLGTMSIVINLTFCGDWAGSVYSSSGCPSTCEDYVNNNPSAFTKAYFQFNGLHIYQ